MDKRVKVVLLIVAVVATAGVIYWLTRNTSSGADTGTSYVPNGTGPSIDTEGIDSTNPVPPPQKLPVSPKIPTSKGDVAFRLLTYRPDGTASVTYFDGSGNTLSLTSKELAEVSVKVKSNKMGGSK